MHASKYPHLSKYNFAKSQLGFEPGITKYPLNVKEKRKKRKKGRVVTTKMAGTSGPKNKQPDHPIVINSFTRVIDRDPPTCYCMSL